MSTYKQDETARALFLARTHIHEMDVGAVASTYVRLWKAEAKIEAMKGVMATRTAERNAAEAEVQRLKTNNKALGITKLSEENARLKARCDAQVATIKRLNAEADVAQCVVRGARHEANKAQKEMYDLKASIRKALDPKRQAGQRQVKT